MSSPDPSVGEKRADLSEDEDEPLAMRKKRALEANMVTIPSSIFLQLLEKAERLAACKPQLERFEEDAKSYELALQKAETKVASLRERLRDARVPRGTPVAESTQA